MKRYATLLIFSLLVLAACSSGNETPPDGDLSDGDTSDGDTTDGDLIDGDSADGDEDGDLTDGDIVDGDAGGDGDTDPEQDGDQDGDPEAEAEWEFDRAAYEPVNGWILLDSNPEAVRESIETAAQYGVNHIQLSHGLIMNIDDVLGDAPAVNVDTLNAGIALAHQYGMKAFVWAHEFSPATINVCYDPDDAIWEARADAYRQALALMPDLDGVILMFGSAPTPPWYTFCTCDWCEENYPDAATTFDSPPQPERIRMVVERIGDVIVNELGLEMFVRTFVHEPAELDFHGEGLASARGVDFTGMHKGPVQDWNPFNPHHANTGAIGPHPSVLELDVAGEYWGQSVLPMCAPGYFRYRFRYAWAHRGIGSVLRVQRGSNHALGTPNEINILALNTFLSDPDTSLAAIWAQFIQDFYGVQSDAADYSVLQRILDDTFHVRVKSHYLLGLWALGKNSNLPGDTGYDQFTDRGDMPKWDADWTERWNEFDKPTEATVRWIWQEGSEALELAQAALDTIDSLQDDLSADAFADLKRRVVHQYQATRAFRAAKTWIVAKRALGYVDDQSTLIGWMQAMLVELATIKDDMTAADLASEPIANPGEVASFLDKATDATPAGAAATPPDTPISAVRMSELSASSVKLTFTIAQAGHVYVDYGTEIPNYGQTEDAGELTAGEISVTLTGLPAGERVVVRVRLEAGELSYRGGDWWIFTPAAAR